MQLAVNMESFARLFRSSALDAATCIRACKCMGADAIELVDMLIRDIDFPLIAEALHETGCRVCSYDLHCRFATPDAFVRAGQLAKVRAGLHRAAAVQAPVVLVVPGALPAGVTPEQAQEWYQDALRASVPAAAQLGTQLAVENVGAMAMARYCGISTHINAICRAAGPGVGTVYDVGNYLMCGEDSLAAMAHLEAPILHVHFKDWHLVDAAAPQDAYIYPGLDGRYYRGAVLGEGVVNLGGALDLLRTRRYAGAISVEYEGPDRPDACLARAVSYMQELLSA